MVRSYHLFLAVFLFTFIVLSLLQYIEFQRPALETFGYNVWRLNGYIGFYTKGLEPVVNVSYGVSLVRIPVEVEVRVGGDGYSLFDSRSGVEILRARFSGRDVLWLNWSDGSFVNVGFSPFLVVWPTKPKPILMHLTLRQVDVRYLGFKPQIDYDWIISEESPAHLSNGSIVYVKRVGILEIRTPLTYVYANVSTPGGHVVFPEAFSWFFVEYKGSLPIRVYAVLPIEFVNREFLASIDIKGELSGEPGYIEFSLSAERGEELRVAGGTGVLYFLYPVLGALLSGMGVVLYLWVLRVFLKRT